jgi:hypothetical protein
MSNRFADRIIEKRRKGSGAREPVPALKVVGPGAAARPEGERQS